MITCIQLSDLDILSNGFSKRNKQSEL